MDKILEKKLKRLAKRICPDGGIEWNDFEKLGKNVLVMERMFGRVCDERDKLLLDNIKLVDIKTLQRGKFLPKEMQETLKKY